MLSELFIGCFQSKNKQTKKRNPRKREEQTDTTRSTDKESNTDGGILGYLYAKEWLGLFIHRRVVGTIYTQMRC